MRDRDPDLDDLQRLLGACLGRIDEQAHRIAHGDDAADPDAVASVLEDETAHLQQLVESLLLHRAAERIERADLDHTVARCVRAVLAQALVPLVVRERLAGNLPPVACAPGQLAHAVQRALALAAAFAGRGGEISVVTRREDDDVLFELHCTGGAGDLHLRERTVTLRAFVAEFHGRCEASVDATGGLWLALELPTALEPDERSDRLG
jgi:signal transduction histidine kinase